MEASLLQTVYLQNDQELLRLIDGGGWTSEAARGQVGARPGTAAGKSPPGKLDASAVVRQAYLRTLSRYPDESELARCRQEIEQSADPLAGVRNVLWALLNTKEFIVNH